MARTPASDTGDGRAISELGGEWPKPGHPAGGQWARWVSAPTLAAAETAPGPLPDGVFASLAARACPPCGVISIPPGAVMALAPEGQILLLTVDLLP